MTIFKKCIQSELGGDCNHFYPCLKDLIQFIDGYRLETKDLLKFVTLESLSNLDQRPDDCEINEDESFFGCKNILLVLSDMDFVDIDSFKDPYRHSIFNDQEQVYYSETTMRQDIRRVFGQSQVRDNINIRLTFKSSIKQN